MNSLVILFLLLVGPVKAGKKFSTVFRMDDFSNCPIKDVPIQMNESGIEAVGKVSKGYGTLLVPKPIKFYEKSVITITRCSDRAYTDCELFQNWRFGTETCTVMSTKNAIWSPLFAYTPPMVCPVKPGAYRIRNATVDTSKLSVIKFPTDGFWKVAIAADSVGILQYCMNFAGKFERIRM